MKRSAFQILVLTIVIGFSFATYHRAAAQDDAPVKLKTLMKTGLAVDDDLDITVSYVEIGPDLGLPKHFHPGEEFVYMLEGEVVIWQQGKPDTSVKQGEVFKVPLEQIHAASTGNQTAKAIVFRVHRKGQPERILIED